MAPKTKKKQREDKKKVEQKTGNNCSKVTCLTITSIVTIIIGVGAYHIYTTVTTEPDLPDFDLNIWWGPNSTKAQDTSIRPFRIYISDAVQENIRRKFDNYRRANKIKSLNESWSYGINSDALGLVFSHWQFKYNYRERSRYLNKFRHFRTKVQGLDIHYIHEKAIVKKNVKVYPILLLHGWPGSVREFYHLIPLLTTPKAGYDFAFEVIVPSYPGFLYSTAPSKPGLTTYQIAIVIRNLMKRIGFNQYYVQGGDFGHIIGSHMATIFPNEVLGFHTNFPVNFSKYAMLAWILGGIWPTFAMNEYADRMYPLKDKIEYYLEESGYMHLQGTKPDTVGVALQDSPIGLAAYLIDKHMMFTNTSYKYTEDGGLFDLKMDELVDNVMLYWITGSITTALRLYKESFNNAETEQILARIPTQVPTWGLRTYFELVHQPDCILRWKYPSLVGTTNLKAGGHFAAFEKPMELSDDVFKAVKKFLEFKRK